MTASSMTLGSSTKREAESLSSIIRVWKFTAGHTGGRGFMDCFLRNQRVALGYVYNRGLSRVRTPRDLSRLRNWYGERLSRNVQRQMWDFLSMRQGDVVALKLKDQVAALGVVTTGELLYEKSPFESKYFRREWNYPNAKSVQWLSKFVPQPIEGEDFVKSFRYPQDTVHEITQRFPKNRILEWVLWYRDNLATRSEKETLNELGRIRVHRGVIPKRKEMALEIGEVQHPLTGSRKKSVLVRRKYGAGGEGADHKKLKEWVAQNPHEVGLGNVLRKEIEYPYPSGDIADIMFELQQGRYAVVEIETIDPFPGAYQALKYKVLKCAEARIDVKDTSVEAVLVAWSVPTDVRKFCREYGIRFVEKKP